MSIAGELSILGTTKSVQRQHLERLYPYIDWSKMPFSSYDDFFALKNILDDCGAVWTNAYGRSNSEDASTRDILPDYSGNGRDIKLYNFDFTESSGYSGGGLVSDGVDDYGRCVKDFALPDDYTVVAMRQYPNGSNDGMLLGKINTMWAQSTFCFEHEDQKAYSFGVQNYGLQQPALFSYQTKNSYNGTAINFGDASDTDNNGLWLFHSKINSYYKGCVLYSLGIFTRTLTDEEMRIVKNCMMAEWAAMTGELDNITYVADWDGKDRSNEEDEPMRSQWVDKATGKVIDLHNYAYAGMSGWGGYGQDFSAWAIVTGAPYQADLITVNANMMRIKGTFSAGCNRSGLVLYYAPLNNEEKFFLKVSGLKKGQLLYIRDETPDIGNSKNYNIDSDGIADIRFTTASTTSNPNPKLYIFVQISEGSEVVDVTIEQLPLYPGALVSDGIDDYGVTQEAINEEVGTVLLHYSRLVENPDKRGYYMDGLYSSRLYISYGTEGNIVTNLFGVTDDGEILTGKVGYTGPATEKLNIASNYQSKEWGQIALYRLILIREQLDGAQVEFLKWKVDKEHRDWLIRMGLYEEEIPWYGIEFDTTDPSPDVKRIGNMKMHRTLPVQSQMRGCLLNDDGTVAKYLDTADWTSETRDGSAGQVMVEMPKDAYWRFETWGTKRRVKFATTALPGFTRTPQGYDSAYEASVQRSANKLCSVVNTDADYRGGNNSSDRDGTYRSQLGLPATAISRTNFRTYARNRNADSNEWNCMTYDFQKLVYWLFAVEYATLNTQKTFNADRDADGLAQGGLGAGVTTVNYNRWHNFNGAYPFIPCGHTDSLGNGTGQIQFTMPFEFDASPSSSTGLGNNYVGEYLSETAYTSGQFVSQGEDLYECISDTEAGTPLTDTIHFSKVTRTAVQVPRYRGLENPFGHIWQWTDGINVRISPDSDNGGDGLSKVFVTDNPEYFNDSNYDNMSYIGNEARSEGYIKEIIFGEGGEIMPSVVGGSSTTYFCDYHYTNIPATETLRGVLFGGSALNGAYAGFGFAYSNYSPSITYAYFGSRLCFIPEKA